jgi:assimilatory nitrate reductase electron transfer subunit
MTARRHHLPGRRRTRVVVVGHGMAATRFVDDVTRHSADVAVTVLGDEPRGGYNRVLLTSVLAADFPRSDVWTHDAGWYRERGVTVRDGTEVTGIDRAASLVTCADGTQVGYDRLVLATGGIPAVPPITGLRSGPGGRLLDGCHTFRTLADCEALLAEACQARRAVVLGGGVLGLEVARALSELRVDVRVVHRPGTLMDAQLDPDGAAVLRRVVQDLGIDCHLSTMARAVYGRNRVAGVVLDDGVTLDCDFLVAACGIKPDTTLADKAGLATRHGVLVDDAMRSVSDQDVLAIGDCAEHRGRVYGLAAPALEQATVAARTVLTDRPAGGVGANPPAGRYSGSATVTRLKARGVELASMGEVGPEPHDEDDTEVVKLVDPARGRYAKLITRDGRLIGAVILGDADVAASVTVAYDRQSILPPDRMRLLTGGGQPAADPADLPDAAAVCRCNAVTAGEIRTCAGRGARSVAAIARETMATTGCGTCRSTVAALLTGRAATTRVGDGDAGPDDRHEADRVPGGRTR